MPAVFDSLTNNFHMTAHKAWRVSFIVPFIIITAVACGILFLGEDCPNGKWADRHINHITPAPAPESSFASLEEKTDEKTDETIVKSEKVDVEGNNTANEVDEAEGELIVTPTLQEGLNVLFSLQTLCVAAPYACSFGAELAINSVLGSYYLSNFPKLGQTGTGRWAAMFGLMNFVFRPLGGLVADLIYKKTGSVMSKKIWLTVCGILIGCFEIAIGLKNSHSKATMFGLVAGLAVFIDVSNGANFSIVPHVHPFANGILSGIVGAAGNC